MRTSGILMPIFSLPSKYGIGCFSKEAYRFIDALKQCGQTYWQILPLGPTGYGDSPYQSFSTFAGNPYFISLEDLVQEGLLRKEECEACDFGGSDRYIEYEKLYRNRFSLLKKAYNRSGIEKDADFQEFVQQNRMWLEDYALFMSVKHSFGEVSWDNWDEDIRLREKDALEKYKNALKGEITFYEYVQYLFAVQWKKLKKYANQNGIQIIGDIPIYVAFDSADSWSHPELYQFDGSRNPAAVAGCPPDGFSKTGQLWGNPLYDWEYHKKTGYAWWIQRIAYCFQLYDVVRVDHFRGFDEYYSIPFGNATAEFGHWEKGPGMDLFRCLSEKLGSLNIIAEDLGYVTDSVRGLVKNTGYPGMKILEFAFDSREKSDYLPYNYEQNCVVYTGTHDNDTVKGWFQSISVEDRQTAVDYMGNERTPPEEIHWDFIRLALGSVARIAIIPIQDYLGLGTEARINQPSTIGNNWKWRLKEGELSEALIRKIGHLTELYGRK